MNCNINKSRPLRSTLMALCMILYMTTAAEGWATDLEEDCCNYEYYFNQTSEYVCCIECNCGVPWTDAGRQCQTVNCANVVAFPDINNIDDYYDEDADNWGPCPANLCVNYKPATTTTPPPTTTTPPPTATTAPPTTTTAPPTTTTAPPTTTTPTTTTTTPTTTTSKPTSRPSCSINGCPRPALDKIMNTTEVTVYLDTVAKLPSGKVALVNVGDVTLANVKPYARENVPNARQWPDRPVIWIEAGIEANNFISVSVALNFMDYLINDCKKYCQYEYFLLPYMNQKGYAYAKSTDNTWVKTREDVGSGCKGVNLLENFKHGDWSSGVSEPCSNLYRGTSEMSSSLTGYQMEKKANKNQIRLSLTLTKSGKKLSYPYAHSTAKTIPEAAAYSLYLEKYAAAAATSLSGAAYTIGSYAANHGVNHGHPLDYNYEEYKNSFNVAFENDDAKLAALVDEFTNGLHAMIEHAKAVQGF